METGLCSSSWVSLLYPSRHEPATVDVQRLPRDVLFSWVGQCQNCLGNFVGLSCLMILVIQERGRCCPGAFQYRSLPVRRS